MKPIQLALAIRQTLDYRQSGMSQIAAVQQACKTVGIDLEFALIIQLSLDSSTALATSWAERQRELSLDRAYVETARG